METLLVAGSKMVASIKAAWPATVSLHGAPFLALSTQGVAKPWAVSALAGMVILQSTPSGWFSCFFCFFSASLRALAPSRTLATPMAWAPPTACALRAPLTCACTTPVVTPSRLPRATAMIAVRCTRLARRAAARWPRRLETYEDRILDMTAATFSSASRGMAGASTSSMSTPANYRVDASGLSNILSRELRSGLRRISIRAKICIPIRVPGGRHARLEAQAQGFGSWIPGSQAERALGDSRTTRAVGLERLSNEGTSRGWQRHPRR
jgi:hypothetical protein